jgi:hypothetical protein
VTNEEVRTILNECLDKLKPIYPILEPSDISPQMAFTTGFLLATIVEGLAADAQNRQIHQEAYHHYVRCKAISQRP